MDDKLRFPRFPRVPQFGPFDTPEFMRTFGIDCSVGRLTAMASRNLDTARRVAVFIPGFTGSKEDFIPFFPYLWRELCSTGHDDFAIVAYSQRGQADSAAPNDRNSYALDDFVADGCEVLERLGADDRPIDLVGHSFGGVVARRVALRRPELLRSLTVFDSGAVPVKLSPVIKAGPAIIRLLGPMVMYWAYRPKLRDEPQADRLAELFRQCMHASSKYHLASVADFMTKFDDVTDELKMFHVKHDVPINIMYGKNDDVWPNDVYDGEAAALGITPIAFDNAGHLAQDDQPEPFAKALVRFWDRC